MATAGHSFGLGGLIAGVINHSLAQLGEISIFGLRTAAWGMRRLPSRGTFLSSCYFVGVRSVPVVAITGLFIGMVLAVQSFSDFDRLGFGSRLGAIINISVVRELGPVLAATMIAGRVGCAMAAELGTMRITEQIDAMTCLGANPLHYLVLPRVLACTLLTPLLTIVADCMGIVGGALICLHIYGVEPHYYWMHARDYVAFTDVLNGLTKALFFGLAISLISCYRGFHCRPGAEGVGRAATESFVLSFISILVLDFFLAMFLSNVSNTVFPVKSRRLL
jgi:phospholipid/cholesterol/gamma-HCH transport system permease protein